MGHVITTRDPYQMAAKVLKLPMPIVGRQLAFTISSPQYKYFWQDIKYHHSPNFGRPKQGQTFVVPTFHIHFLNPQCEKIPWVLAPKNFQGKYPQNPHTLRIQKMYMKGWYNKCLTLFWPPKLGECNKMGSVGKILSR